MVTNLGVSIEINGLSKLYDNKIILNEIDFNIKKGEFVSIIGPNGCGKSTLLKCISNLISYKGNIKLNSNNVGYVGQNPNDFLLPWLNVKSNIVFPLKKGSYNEDFLFHLMELTNLKDYSKHYPYQLSGGMEHMLLISRAMLSDSEILLLDEPFKSLDFIMSEKMQKKLLEIWKLKNPTIIMISHNISEAITMSDKIIILSNKPTKIKKIIDVNLPRENRHSLITSEEYIKIKEEILNEINKN